MQAGPHDKNVSDLDQVCYDKNTDFSVGETFKMAMVAELATGQEIVDMYSDVDSIADLCTCFDLNASGNSTVDCQTIDKLAIDPQRICKASEHKQLNEAGDACVCMTGYTEDAETHACEAE